MPHMISQRWRQMPSRAVLVTAVCLVGVLLADANVHTLWVVGLLPGGLEKCRDEKSLGRSQGVCFVFFSWAAYTAVGAICKLHCFR